MLEEYVPDSVLVARCVIRGSYYRKQKGLRVWVVRDFLQMLKGLSPEKKRIVMSNLYTRLDAIPRYNEALDEAIPF